MHEQYALPTGTLNALEDFLDSEANEHGLDFHGAHGYLTAITVGPRGTLDADALAAFFEDEAGSMDPAQMATLTQQLQAWQKSIHAVLYHGSRLELPCPLIADSDEPNSLSDWCVGFMEGLFLDEDRWYAGNEDDIADLTLPMVVLSDLIEDDDLQTLRRDKKLLKDMTASIPDLITELYLLFHAPTNP